MAVYRLTPQRVAALSMALRYHQSDGVMRVEHIEEMESFLGYDTDFSPRFRRRGSRTVVSIELEFYGGEDMTFLEEDAMFDAPTVMPSPPPDYEPVIDLLSDIVKVIVRAWAMDDNRIRFGLLELD